MKEKGTYASEPVAMTYGMSDELRNSDLLHRISGLSTKDKQCLIRYISEESAEETDNDDALWDSFNDDQPPYTLEELYARIEESEAQYQRGEFYTAEESDAILKKKYLWLQ